MGNSELVKDWPWRQGKEEKSKFGQSHVYEEPQNLSLKTGMYSESSGEPLNVSEQRT